MNPEPTKTNEPNGKWKSPKLTILGLFLAFVPSVFLLLLFNDSVHGNMFFVATFSVSIVCCFVSSSLFFRYKAGWAFLTGFLFLILNAAISFLLGCCAVIGG